METEPPARINSGGIRLITFWNGGRVRVAATPCGARRGRSSKQRGMECSIVPLRFPKFCRVGGSRRGEWWGNRSAVGDAERWESGEFLEEGEEIGRVDTMVRILETGGTWEGG